MPIFTQFSLGIPVSPISPPLLVRGPSKLIQGLGRVRAPLGDARPGLRAALHLERAAADQEDLDARPSLAVDGVAEAPARPLRVRFLSGRAEGGAQQMAIATISARG